MKFVNLFRKEVRELMTVQSILGILVAVIIFALLGQVMGNATSDMVEMMGSVVVCDEDQSEESRQAIDGLKTAGYQVDLIHADSDIALIEEAEKYDHKSVLVFPDGFGEGLQRGETQTLRIVSQLTSFSVFSNSDASASSAATVVIEMMTAALMQAQLPAGDIGFLRSPIGTQDVTVANGRSDLSNSSMLQSFAMQQSIFIPIIVFILISFASQLNASAIANEKGDKTLETLLSAPVSRVAVLSSKMCASGVLSLLMAVVYMFGFSSYMGGMMGGSGIADSAVTASLQNLGLQLGPMQYCLIGIQLFLTIMIALAISMILGALAKDVKSASSMMMPLMFLAMIPYFITMFMDVGSLPLPAQILLYLIPFTHTFSASANLLFGNNIVFFAGMAYQLILLIVVMAAAVHVFSTDKIFTMTLDFSGKRKKKKAKTE